MRSDVIKKGAPAAPNRSLLYALGYTKEELERPLIGVVCSYNEIVPGHMNLDKIAEAVKAAKALEAEGIRAEVINIHTIKPLDEELILASAKKTGRVVTVEEHNIIGGLGEAVSAVLSEKCPTPVTRIGVNDVFGHSGPAVDLLKEFGLSAEHIAEVVREKLGK